jgi:hypothetical protein
LSLLLCNWQWCCTVDSQQLFWFNCVTGNAAAQLTHNALSI